MNKAIGLVAALLTIAAMAATGIMTAQVGGTAGGAISGRVLNSDGTPAVAVGVGVVAIPNSECVQAPYGIQTGRGSFSALSAFAQTDGGGRYRLENIPSGRYILAAGAFSLPPQAGSQCYGQARYGGHIAQPTYFPGVADQGMATSLTVSSGASTAPDFRLTGGPGPSASGFRITGRVVGSPVVNNGGILIVRLANAGNRPATGPCMTFRANVAPDGAFELRNIPPCAYVATVMANYGDTGRGAFPGVDTSTAVVVTDKDIAGLVLGPGTRGGR